MRGFGAVGWPLLALLFLGAIFYNSSLPADESGRLSGMLASLLQLAGDVLNVTFDGDLEHKLRKLAHFLEFSALAWLLCRSFAANGVGQRAANGYILLLCLLAAAADEYIQLFSPGRASRVTDVLLDFSGSFSMWLAVRVWQFCRR